MGKSVLPSDLDRRLLEWYDQHKRALPWRDTRDVYRVWLSEIMLQQTRVETVIPYFLRWLDLFPSIETVAQASDEEILKAWEGLGYYRRAILFQQACRTIMNEHHGSVPDDLHDFHSLPGIGPYTFAAVRSICFDDPVPAVDGNVRRVIARLLMLPQSSSALVEAVYKALLKSISPDRPGDFNQAIMDLGSLVCTPRNPACDSCPLSSGCGALQKGKIADFPVRQTKRTLPHHTIAAGIIWRDQRFLICRRPAGGLLGGLWELPGGKVENGESLEAALAREIQEEVGLTPEIIGRIGSVRHAYSHFSIKLHVFHCALNSGTPQAHRYTETQWISWEDIQRFPFPKANHKLFKLIRSSEEH